MTEKYLADNWKYGFVYVRKTYSDNLKKIASYFLNQVDVPKGIRKYNNRRNVEQPIIEKAIVPEMDISEMSGCDAYVYASRETGEVLGWSGTKVIYDDGRENKDKE